MAIAPRWEILLFIAFCAILFIIIFILILYSYRRFLFAKKFNTSSITSSKTLANKKSKCLNDIVVTNK